MALLFPLMDAASIPVRIDAKLAAACKPRACVRTKHREVRVVRVCDPLRDGRVSYPLLAEPLFRLVLPSSASSPSPSLQQQDRARADEKQKYYVNMGYAIRSLREEFPVIFYREPSFDIYRHDIVFKDPFNTFVGIDNYKRIFWALRFHGQIFFKALRIDIMSVWQPVENVIMIRWTVHGIPRIPWEGHAQFNGTSQYKLDDGGKIFEHQVDNVAINSPPKFQAFTVEELIQSLGCPSTPKPTYFKIVPPLPYHQHLS